MGVNDSNVPIVRRKRPFPDDPLVSSRPRPLPHDPELGPPPDWTPADFPMWAFVALAIGLFVVLILGAVLL